MSEPAENLIKVYDKYGREMFFTKEQWRINVLPGMLKSNWNNPNELYGIIVSALNDGFRADIMEAAKHLYKIDPQHVRSTAVWGIVLMEEGQFDESENIFQIFLANHGEDGVILTNLAKVYFRRGNNLKAEQILWHSLEVDPNQDNGLKWYWSIHHEREGEEGGKQSLQRVAALPGSWRAQLWLARQDLQLRQLDNAVAMYEESLNRAPKPIPADVLMQISGDLGNQGYMAELLKLCAPNFVPEFHGLHVGNNLIKCHLGLGHIKEASGILNQLYMLKRPDWQQTLSFWDTEIAKARVAESSNDQKGAPMHVGLLSIEGPVWLMPESPGTELFPDKKPDAVHICFIAGTAEVVGDSQEPKHQLEDAPGRASRALPLFFAEQIYFKSDAKVQTLIPWIAQERGGFVLSGVPNSDEAAADFARQGPISSDYVVVTHLKCKAEPWAIEIRLVRAIDKKYLGSMIASLSPAMLEDEINQLVQRLQTLLTNEIGLKIYPAAVRYRPPAGTQLPFYLLRIEQLLAVRCGGMEKIYSGFVSGERAIIDGNIQLCLENTDNVTTRILLAKTLLAMKKVRPDILPEFKDKLAQLQNEYPLARPSSEIVQKMFDEALMPPDCN